MLDAGVRLLRGQRDEARAVPVLARIRRDVQRDHLARQRLQLGTDRSGERSGTTGVGGDGIDEGGGVVAVVGDQDLDPFRDPGQEGAVGVVHELGRDIADRRHLDDDHRLDAVIAAHRTGEQGDSAVFRRGVRWQRDAQGVVAYLTGSDVRHHRVEPSHLPVGRQRPASHRTAH